MSGFQKPFFCEKSGIPVAQGDGDKKQCPRDPYYIATDSSEYIDFQILKIQEAPDVIPTGEIPRTYQMCVDRFMVDQLNPGTRCTVTGIYTVSEQKMIKNTEVANRLRLPYVIVTGVHAESTGTRKLVPTFDTAQIERFIHYSKDPKIYERISNSIAPAIYGHENIKNAIACLLFGGAGKLLPDQTKLRGDINILLLGDPSTAKSQLLKFAEKVAPISVYTSGKGSSAAGLTAAIIRDPSSQEFQ